MKAPDCIFRLDRHTRFLALCANPHESVWNQSFGSQRGFILGDTVTRTALVRPTEPFGSVGPVAFPILGCQHKKEGDVV